jgi:hypothetical protein
MHRRPHRIDVSEVQTRRNGAPNAYAPELIEPASTTPKDIKGVEDSHGSLFS